jgi:hypothetical protein
MKATTRIVLGGALYMVLMCASPMLSADGGEVDHPTNQPPKQIHSDSIEDEKLSQLRLGDEQLDSIVAAQGLRFREETIFVPADSGFCAVTTTTFDNTGFITAACLP